MAVTNVKGRSAGDGGGNGSSSSSSNDSSSNSNSSNSSRSGSTGREVVKIQPEGEEEDKFRFSGQVIAAIVVAAVAGNVVGARHYRKTILSQVGRHAQRKKEAERASQAAKERAKRGGWNADGSRASFGGNPLYGRTPEGWVFDDSRDAAFAEQRLNSQVVQNLSTLGVKNFGAGKEEVKAAYRDKAMHLHPDRTVDSVLAGGSKKGNEQEFKRVAEAYSWLDENYFRQGGRRRP